MQHLRRLALGEALQTQAADRRGRLLGGRLGRGLLEKRAAGNPDAIRAISDRAQEHGLIAHRFYGSEDGQIMVVDEWPDPGSFQAFFEEARSEIEPLMREIGVTSEPEITFWRKLDSHDEVGWNA